ncbi:MAG: ARC6/PARC6 family protein, partial [Alkalinema sp. CAN_BIN05]|nr:ARC6/PARC6 family protein [Alkalinema sp. CAN_BIN05]
LEQSVCALFLGQTEEAIRLLELSQEYEPIALIREHSHGSPVWLPGLCLYAERWLGSEVFPHFRDLSQRHAALKDYFADEKVQMYLEELPADTLEPAQRPAIVVGDREDVWSDAPTVHPSSSSLGSSSLGSSDLGYAARSSLESISVGGVRASLQFEDSDPIPEAIVPDRKDKDRSQSSNRKGRVNAKSTQKSESSKLYVAPAVGTMAATTVGAIGAGATHNAASEPNVKAPRYPQSDDRSRRIKGVPPRRNAKWRYPMWFPWALGCLGVMAIGLGLGRLSKEYATRNATPTPDPIVTTMTTAIPKQPVAIQGDLNNATAKQVLDLWFTVKKAAMGSGHSTNQLEQVLIEPKLSEWQRMSSQDQRDGSHVEYEHAIDVKKVEVSATNSNEALVTANIRELRKYYEGNTIKDQQTDDLTVQYTLSRQNNQWKISTWQSAQS